MSAGGLSGTSAMSTRVNVHEAQARLLELLDRVAEGEEVIITEAGEPVARLVAATKRPAPRIPGKRKRDAPDLRKFR